jgi:hypothetical protein
MLLPTHSPHGSIPQRVIRTGVVLPMGPAYARHDIQTNVVEERVTRATGRQVPAELQGSFAGTDAFGQPVTEFQMAEAVAPEQAMAYGAGLHKLGRFIRKHQIRLPAELRALDGVFKTLAQDKAVVLRFRNGATVSVEP